MIVKLIIPHKSYGGYKNAGKMIEKIGKGLTRIDVMTKKQVEITVFRKQNAGDNRLFGEIAIEFGYINMKTDFRKT